MCVYQMPWFSSPWHSCKLEMGFVGVRLLQPENETQRPEQIATNRSSHMYIGRNFLNVLRFEAICISRNLDLCYLIRSYHTLRTCSALGTSLRDKPNWVRASATNQCKKRVRIQLKTAKWKMDQGFINSTQREFGLKDILWDGSCLKAAVPSSFMSTENLAIPHVDFGARTLMAMLYSLNHGSDE